MRVLRRFPTLAPALEHGGLCLTTLCLLGPVLTEENVAELRAVSEEQRSMRVTLDTETRRELETLTRLLAHKLPGGDLAGVLKEAIRLEKHGKRRGAVAPVSVRAQRASAPGTIPAELKRRVWERDGGCCTPLGTAPAAGAAGSSSSITSGRGRSAGRTRSTTSG